MTTEALRPYVRIIKPIDYVTIDSFRVRPSSGFAPLKSEWIVKFSGRVKGEFPLDEVVLKDLAVALGFPRGNSLYVSTFARLGDFTLTKTSTSYYVSFKPGDLSFIEKISWMEDGRSIEPTLKPRRIGRCYLLARGPRGMRVLTSRIGVIPQVYRKSVTPAWRGELEFYVFMSPVWGELPIATKCTGYPPPPPPPPPQPAPPTAVTAGPPPETVKEAIERGLTKPPPPRYGPCLNKMTDGCERIFVVDFEYVPNPYECTTSARTNGYVILSSAGAQEFRLDYVTTHGNPTIEITLARGRRDSRYRIDNLLVNGVPLKPSPWPVGLEFPGIATFYL
jgi:hypothetical protein